MKAFRSLSIASLAVAVLATGGAQAASTTDYSDQWWVPSESGWGASVQQQADVLFVDVMVYANDGRPVWFTSAASRTSSAKPGHDVFAGDLYATTGPTAPSFDASKVVARKVGVLQFDASSASAAILSYSVDGVTFSKNVSRQTWEGDALRVGEYRGYWWNNCPGTAFDWEPTRIVVTRDGEGRFVLALSCPWCWGEFNHELRGTYSQDGHLGRIAAEMMPPDSGSVLISEIEWNGLGFTARLSGRLHSSGQTCEIGDGRVGAIVLP